MKLQLLRNEYVNFQHFNCYTFTEENDVIISSTRVLVLFLYDLRNIYKMNVFTKSCKHFADLRASASA